MGMSMDDFCRCTPSEFYEAWKCHQQQEVRKERSAWERYRWLATCMVQPYSKKALGVKDIAVFPWEKEEPTRQDAKPAMSTEEIMVKYREALKQYGFK
jgi:hypothetical protein